MFKRSLVVAPPGTRPGLGGSGTRKGPLKHQPRRLVCGAVAAWCVGLLVFCIGTFADPATVLHPEPSGGGRAPSLAIGMNLSRVAEWNREWVFVDLFKASRSWVPQKSGRGQPWKTDEKLELTPHGWPVLGPGQAAGTVMCRGMDGYYPGGRYTLTYTGRGTVKVGFDAKKTVRTGPNRFEVLVEPSRRGIYLRVDRSDPQDPVRDICLWMPGFEDVKAPFHPLFLDRLRPFRVIRFMDWQRTNHSTVRRWSDRTTPESARQSGDAGVALEYMIELCNTLGVQPWFCMPHLAEDEFVRSFAQMVFSRLDPRLKVYVEWSNEVWNTAFAQGRWLTDEAERQGVSRQHVAADEALRDWRIWQEVFGDQKDRVIRVAAGHHHGPRYLPPLLDQLDGRFDVVSCSAYFHVPPKIWKTLDEKTTVDDVIRGYEAGIGDFDVPALVRHGKLARAWSEKLGRHIPFVAYEAGQSHSLRGPDKRLMGVFGSAQGDPRMYRLYNRWLQTFHRAGGELFVAFNYAGARTRHGAWGHLTRQDESLEDAPKFRALWDAARMAPSSAPVSGRTGGASREGR